MDLTIIIVNWNAKHHLLKCLASILESKNCLKCQIIVVDNNSSDGSQEAIKESFKDIEIINSGGNLGFAKANNLAIPLARAPFILFLNPDTIVNNNSLITMLNFINNHNDVGVLGCKTVNTDGSLNNLGIELFPSALTEIFTQLFISDYTIRKFGKYLPFHDPETSGYVFGVFGMCMMVRKTILDKIGYFDERFFMYCEDFDLCHRIKHFGKKIYYLSEVEIMHVGGGASSLAGNKFSILMMQESKSILMKKYKGDLGVFSYRIATLIGAIYRLILLFIMLTLTTKRQIGKKENLTKLAIKYITKIKWALKIEKPFIIN